MKSILRKTICVLAALALATTSHAMSMQELFDNVQAQGNITDPASISGQTMNVYTGGSMFMRMPRRTYNVATFTPPSWNAGCGGIDIFAGGFSYINKEQFVALLRNIGSNALGYGFKLAIQNLCPTCDNVMQALQATAQAINRQNIDSCQAAKGIIHAAMPDTWTADKQNAAKGFGVDGNVFEDITDAWTSVMNNESRANETIQQTAEDRPELRDSQPTGNITWNALKKLDGITDDYRMLLMSMIGTTILRTDDEVRPMQIILRKEISLESFIGGNARNADGTPRYEISLPIWRCNEMDQCLEPYEDTIQTASFKSMIAERLAQITDNISQRRAYPDPGQVIRFLNTTEIPIYKMLAVTTSLNNTQQADNLINRYQELIAAKYAEVYIKRVTVDLRAAMNRYAAQASPSVSKALEDMKPETDRLDQEARQALVTAYTQTISTFNVAQEVAHLERAMTANLSQTMLKARAFGNSLR